MNKVDIYFKNQDYIEHECTDILLDHGMLLVFIKAFSEDPEDVSTFGYNLSDVESFELIRMKGEEYEGISEEQ